MTENLRLMIQRFPASIILLILLLASMWGNRQYERDVEELCEAGSILLDEGSVAWEGWVTSRQEISGGTSGGGNGRGNG